MAKDVNIIVQFADMKEALEQVDTGTSEKLNKAAEMASNVASAALLSRDAAVANGWVNKLFTLVAQFAGIAICGLIAVGAILGIVWLLTIIKGLLNG